MDPLTKYELENLCNMTPEGRIISDPNSIQIEEMFVSMQNYKMCKNAPLILETFN